MTPEWAALAAGAVMLLVGAAMWAWAQVLLGRAEAEHRRVEQERLDGLIHFHGLIRDWERRQLEILAKVQEVRAEALELLDAARQGEGSGC